MDGSVRSGGFVWRRPTLFTQLMAAEEKKNMIPNYKHTRGGKREFSTFISPPCHTG